MLVGIPNPGKRGDDQQTALNPAVAIDRPRWVVWSAACCIRTDKMCAL
ncbi:hypothetical protein SAMN05920897_1551 [Alkalispirochaeta americana]|uniref:Uncharacterized protein n=1 Tax=Alkalispirochaeta americana TaxID=159291 RepID=A0A1N6YGV5_9SPIO|nr:hypothetical protein SAMN05920897_1551 [Alkalispirochaeta americana]